MSPKARQRDPLVNNAAFYSPQSFGDCPSQLLNGHMYPSPTSQLDPETSQLPDQHQQAATWTQWDQAPMCAPVARYEACHNSDPNASLQYFHGAVHLSQHTPYNGLPLHHHEHPNPVFQMSANPLTPQSPPNQDWAGLSTQGMEGQPSKRARTNTPSTSQSPYMESDGIRKKNARFEIPGDRNLSNIDFLIQQASDDELKKELKTHKRLLRNRQAALDSRQRKKNYTERLEEEKKAYVGAIQGMEEELQHLRQELDHRIRESQDWHKRHVQTSRYIETMRLEKEEMLRQHTIERGRLQSEVKVLTERVRELESSTAVTAAWKERTTTGSVGSIHLKGPTDTVNAGLTDPEWDATWAFIDGDEYPPSPPESTCKALATQSIKGNEENMLSQSLLWMLLLCGALVASKCSSTKPTAIPVLPKLPQEVCVASATVLDTILNGRDLATPDSKPGLAPAHVPSSGEWPPATLSGAELASLSGIQFLPTMYSSTAGFGYKITTPVEAITTESECVSHLQTLLTSTVPPEVIRDFKRLLQESGSR